MTIINRTVSIAPMMDYTDRYYRYLARLLSSRILLYTEMVTAHALQHGDRDKLLRCDNLESPVALQLGGSDPKMLQQAARWGEDYGYDEINLNVGCPSDRVQSGRFGVCLMKEPERVADCVVAMQSVVDVPVTVKTRIGVDHDDSYEFLLSFIEKVRQAGCRTFIIHARKAWLKGLSPKQNRTVPPLNYERVYQLKLDYPDLEIVINGGVQDNQAVATHLQQVDGVMIGREACRNIAWLHELDRLHYAPTTSVELNRYDVLSQYLEYVELELASGSNLQQMMKPVLGLFAGVLGAREIRRQISEKAREGALGLREIQALVEKWSQR